MDRLSREKINKETQDLNDTIDCVCAKSLQPSPTLCGTLCGPMNCSLPGSSVMEFSSQEYLSGLSCTFRGSSQPNGQTYVSYISCIGRWLLYHQCHLASTAQQDQVDLIDIYRTFYLKSSEYTFFSSAHKTFSKIYHTLVIQTLVNLRKLKLFQAFL